jgi:(E)-4-hydroxy-3-methylbut-2-enyl-diphosphate synthase
MSQTTKRKNTRRIMLGGVAVGGGAPISVQSMTNTKTDDVRATVHQIQRLTLAGCEIVRVAVPDQSAAEAISRIKPRIDIPLVADIHFDYRLAIAAARNGADGLRFNPGNIDNPKHIKARWLIVCQRLPDSHPYRRQCRQPGKGYPRKPRGRHRRRHGGKRHAARGLLRDLDFHDIKISIKASDVPRPLRPTAFCRSKPTCRCMWVSPRPGHFTRASSNRPWASAPCWPRASAIPCGFPHPGSGGGSPGGLRNPAGTGHPPSGAGNHLLPHLRTLRHRLFDIVEKVERALMTRTVPVKLAIMGCVVNGPGEAREADIGVAGGSGSRHLVQKG